ncbi:MAG: hypothetical protein CM15mP21_1220 [Hyphomicrobiales bacterium]|nr:MAG: hypothetical protein CM15mP21_1220 [Hyphomicrobiales bacterium]
MGGVLFVARMSVDYPPFTLMAHFGICSVCWFGVTGGGAFLAGRVYFAGVLIIGLRKEFAPPGATGQDHQQRAVPGTMRAAARYLHADPALYPKMTDAEGVAVVDPSGFGQSLPGAAGFCFGDEADRAWHAGVGWQGIRDKKRFVAFNWDIRVTMSAGNDLSPGANGGRVV